MATYASLWDRIRSAFRTVQIRTKGVALPPRISYRPVSRPIWRDSSGASEVRRVLLELGFVDAGVHSPIEIPNMQMAFFVNPESSVVGSFYESRHAGIWVDFVTDYIDHTSFNFSSAPAGRIHDVPEWDNQQSFSRLSPSQLYEKFLRERPNKPMHAVSVATVIENAERAWAWRFENGR